MTSAVDWAEKTPPLNANSRVSKTSLGAGWGSLLPPYVTVFISSACIMVIELVAGRLVSRYIGQSLYTWTTIIGVVLAGISLGNYLGGRLADRSWGRRTLGLQLLVAALGCVSVFPLNEALGQWQALEQCAWPLRIFLHILLTFVLPAGLLGTISPVIAKRALRLGIETGRTIGSVYAWAISGSIIGTYLTGFYLLTVLGATAVAGGAAAMLALLGLLYVAGSLKWAGFSKTGSPGFIQTRFWRIASIRENRAILPEQRAENGTAPSASSSLFGPVATVFIANGCIMLMEIVAGRLISRYYGQSLFSWTAVIGVILAGMSLGSYLGGRLADRFRPDKLLGYLFIFGSMSCLTISVITKVFVYSQFMVAFSWPTQIQAHCLASLFLPSILLGAVAPVVVKMALLKGHGEGRTVGTIYAWGSIGSILGTFAAGFWMIAEIGSLLTLFATASILAIMGAIYGRKTAFAYAWVLVCGVAILFTAIPLPSLGVLGEYLSFRVTPAQDARYTRESQYSFIAVLDDPQHPNIRQMTLDHLVHSKIDLDHPTDLQYEYELTYAAILDEYYPAPKPMTSLVIGGGGYAFPRYLELTRPGGSGTPAGYTEVAEIDPAVTEAAHLEFGLPRDTTIHIFNMDARNRIADLLRAKRAGEPVPVFDCIFGDSINDFSVPYHLTTIEFNQGLYELLADDGMYLFNMIDMLDSGQFISAVLNTCRQTFPYVYAFCSHNDPHERDTFIVVASKRSLDVADVPDKIRAARPGYTGKYLDPKELDALAKRTRPCVLTDDFAPVDNLLAPVVRLSQVSEQAYLKMIRDALANEDYGRTISLCHILLRAKPNSAEGHELLGIASSATNDLDRAIAELNKSIEISTAGSVSGPVFSNRSDSPKPALRDSSGPGFGESLRFEKTRPLSGAAVPGGLAHATAYDALGSAYFKKGDREAAIRAWKTAIALNSGTPKPFENYGGALVKWGQTDAAIAMLNKAIELDPKSAAAHVNMASALFNKNDIRGAIRELNTVLAVAPDYAGIHHQLAVAYWKSKDYDKAWQEVDNATHAGEHVDANFINALQRDSGKSR